MSEFGKIALNARKRLASDAEPVRQREQTSSWRGFLGGYLLGAVVGMVIALLLAPRRGDETRRMVITSTGGLRERATGLVHRVREDGESTAAPPRRDTSSEPAIERTFGA